MKAADIRIREADPRDLDSLRFEVEHGPYAGRAVPREKLIAEFTETIGRGEVFVAELALSGPPQVVGQAYATDTDFEGGADRYSWLFYVFVDPALRGQGIGTRLVETVILRAKRLGLAGVVLGVEPTNAGAVRLYERLGFREFGRREINPEILLGEGGGAGTVEELLLWRATEA